MDRPRERRSYRRVGGCAPGDRVRPDRMAERMSAGESIDLEAVVHRIGDGKPVRRTLPQGGRVHIDRPLPFFCVYRAPKHTSDLGTAELVRAQASYLIAENPEHSDAELARVVGAVVGAL